MSKLQPERKGAIAASPAPNSIEWNPTSSSPSHMNVMAVFNKLHPQYVSPFLMQVYPAKVCVLHGYSDILTCLFVIVV